LRGEYVLAKTKLLSQMSPLNAWLCTYWWTD